MSDRRLEEVLIEDIHTEDGVRELLSSPNMRPYIQMAKALQDRKGVQSCLESLAKLPLEKRCVWRITSVLKWAFADFDSTRVAVDRHTFVGGSGPVAGSIEISPSSVLDVCEDAAGRRGDAAA